MGSLLFEVAFIVVLLLINGLFSMSELAIVSARKIRLQQRADKGDSGARAALELANAPNRFLSTVQIGITLVGVLAGAFGGAGLARYLSGWFEQIPILAHYADGIGFAIVVGAITYLSVVVGELIPKSVALNYPEAIASAVSRPMRFLSTAAAPAVWFLSAPTGFILRFFKIHAVVEPPISDDEIKGLIQQGTEAGVFEESEQNLLEKIIHLDDRRITALMTQRLDIVWLDLDASIETLRRTINEAGYSRYPIARGSVDNVIGYAALKNLLKQQLNDQAFDLQKVAQPPLYVPETVTALELLEKFKVSHTHLAIVVNEHGATEGLITMTDVLKAIVGDLAKRGNQTPNFIEHENGVYLLDGRVSIDEFKQILDIKELPAGERGQYETLAGFALTQLGKIPQTDDGFEWRGLHFTIAAMDGKRIGKIRATKIKPDV